jgi:hypothetical protein
VWDTSVSVVCSTSAHGSIDVVTAAMSRHRRAAGTGAPCHPGWSELCTHGTDTCITMNAIAGNLRGELAVFDVEHHTLLYKWSAHKRTAITCVKFTHEGGWCTVGPAQQLHCLM